MRDIHPLLVIQVSYLSKPPNEAYILPMHVILGNTNFITLSSYYEMQNISAFFSRWHQRSLQIWALMSLCQNNNEERAGSLAPVNLSGPSVHCSAAAMTPAPGEKHGASCVCVKFPTHEVLHHLIVRLRAHDSAITFTMIKGKHTSVLHKFSFSAPIGRSQRRTSTVSGRGQRLTLLAVIVSRKGVRGHGRCTLHLELYRKT